MNPETSNPSIPIVGLCGSIGAGKSEVARILEELGCVVSHSDREARAELDEAEVRQKVVEWWGKNILDETGQINRSAVAKIVFNDPTQRERLEKLIHPRIKVIRDALFVGAPPGTPALVIDAPLLMEAKLDLECDVIIFVDAPREIRLARLVESRNWDEPELHRRELSQLPLDEKQRRADYVVVNDGERATLADRIRTILHEIVSAT